jgi:hypothetical protein
MSLAELVADVLISPVTLEKPASQKWIPREHRVLAAEPVLPLTMSYSTSRFHCFHVVTRPCGRGWSFPPSSSCRHEDRTVSSPQKGGRRAVSEGES